MKLSSFSLTTFQGAISPTPEVPKPTFTTAAKAVPSAQVEPVAIHITSASPPSLTPVQSSGSGSAVNKIAGCPEPSAHPACKVARKGATVLSISGSSWSSISNVVQTKQGPAVTLIPPVPHEGSGFTSEPPCSQYLTRTVVPGVHAEKSNSAEACVPEVTEPHGLVEGSTHPTSEPTISHIAVPGLSPARPELVTVTAPKPVASQTKLTLPDKSGCG